MNRMPLAAVALVLGACSALPVEGDGVVALELRLPTSLTLKQGDSLTLHARALDKQGDSVAADIRWHTPDTAAVALDSVRGVVVARLATGTARVQAAVGSLHSDLVSITLQPAGSAARQGDR